MVILTSITDVMHSVNVCFLIGIIIYSQSQAFGSNLYEGSNCNTKFGKPGVCTKITECKSVLDGLKMNKITYDDLMPHCSFVDSTPIICCEDRTPSLIVPSRISTSTSTPGQIVFIDDNNDIISFKRSTNKPVQPSSDIRNSARKAVIACEAYKNAVSPSLTYNILDGSPAEPGDFPHMAALGYPSLAAGEDYLWDCGGSLISNRYILTAAHCVAHKEKIPILVRMGTTDLNTKNQSFEFGIEDIILHPDYTTSRVYNDIALIKLNRTVNFDDNLRPACLNTELSDVDTKIKLIATGWGTISTRTRDKSPDLLYTNLNPISLSSCNASHINYGTTRRYPTGLDSGQLCAHDPLFKKDACEGDSGGPLQIKMGQISTIVGVTSFGIGCGSEIPGVYARVSYYLDWIEKNVWNSDNVLT